MALKARQLWQAPPVILSVSAAYAFVLWALNPLNMMLLGWSLGTLFGAFACLALHGLDREC